jgi:transcriptional regulator with XRE-family HTH domain
MNRQYDSVDPNSELAGFVKAWRHRQTRDVGGAPPKPRRRQATVSQEEIAEVIGVSVVWYSNLERGVRANYSDAFLDAVVAALRLSGDERVLLYLLAVGRTPSLLLVGSALVVPDRSLHQFVSGQRWPTYVLNRHSRVVLHNEPCESYFPWLRYDSSYPCWLLTSADARHRLVNWETDWAPPLLAQLRIARARHSDDAHLAAVIDACLSTSPDARRLWDARADHEYAPRSRRGIRLPDDHQTIIVDVVTLTDLKPGELHVVMLLPTAEPA